MVGEGPRERWSREASEYRQPHLRLRQVARLVQELGARSVLDIGAGDGGLHLLLPGLNSYSMADFVPPTDATYDRFIEFDVNAPTSSALNVDVDVVILSGILEYCEDVPALFRRLRGEDVAFHAMVITYYNDGHISRIVRRLLGRPVEQHQDWVPLLSYSEFERAIAGAGMRIIARYDVSRAVTPSPGASETLLFADTLVHTRRWARRLTHQRIFQVEL